MLYPALFKHRMAANPTATGIGGHERIQCIGECFELTSLCLAVGEIVHYYNYSDICRGNFAMNDDIEELGR